MPFFFFFFFYKLTGETKTNETSCSKDGLIQPEKATVTESLGWQNLPKSTSLHLILCLPQCYICSCKHPEDGFRDVGETAHPKYVHANDIHPEVMKKESSKEEKVHSLAGQGLEVWGFLLPGSIWRLAGPWKRTKDMHRASRPCLNIPGPTLAGRSQNHRTPRKPVKCTMRVHWWHERWGASLSRRHTSSCF